MTIIERILDIMKNKNIKKIDLAKYLGINSGNITMWEKRGSSPPVEYLKDIAIFLEVPVDYVLTGEYNYEDKKLNEEQVKILELSYKCPENELNKIIGRMEYIVENLNDN